MGQRLPVFVGEVPEYEPRGEVMVVRWRDVELALPIHVCEKAVAKCNRALDEWHQQHSVLRFPARNH
jgi:hypothetical protein